MRRISLLLAIPLFSGVLSAQPIITQNPQGATVCQGACANLSVTAVGGGLQYQWIEIMGMDSVEIAGAVSSNLEYCPDSMTTSLQLTCEVTDSNGLSVMSNAATITSDSCLAPVADFTWTWNHQEMCFTNLSTNAHTVFWFFGDGNTNDDNVDSICHTYGTKEIYYVKLHAYNDHGVDIVEKVLDLLGKDELESNSLSAFPNPANDWVRIESSTLISQIQLIDAQGRVLLQDNPNRSATQLNLSTVPMGVYSMRITHRDGVTQRKLIVQ
ncbi:MAG: T9SS type A sorting domain-containing protein [Cryomorphaceae bacterium]